MADSQNYYNSQLFESDDETNYANFLSVDNNINPSTSTQLPAMQKPFYFRTKPYDKPKSVPPSVPATSSGSSNLIKPSVTKHFREEPISSGQAHLPHSSPDVPTIMDVCKILNEQGNMMRVLLREVKLLRREQRLYNTKPDEPEEAPPIFQIPACSPAQFEDLEKEVKLNKTKEKLMIKQFETVSDQNMDKFVRACLKLIINDRAASSFSWYGRHENIAVENFHLMNLIKECAMRKFPTCKTLEIVNIIKRWFQYAKDRVKKSNL